MSDFSVGPVSDGASRWPLGRFFKSSQESIANVPDVERMKRCPQDLPYIKVRSWAVEVLEEERGHVWQREGAGICTFPNGNIIGRF